MDTILEPVAFSFLVIGLGALVISKILSTKVKEIQLVDIVQFFQSGWVRLDLETYLNMFSTKKVLKLLSEKESEWLVKYYESGVLAFLHYRNKTQLLTTLQDTHHSENTEHSELQLKRVITASSLLYQFDIPKSLFVLDLETLMLINNTLVSTRLLDLEQCLNAFRDTHIGKPYKVYSKEEIMQYKAIVKEIPTMVKYLGKIGTKRVPNLFHFGNVLKVHNPHTWSVLKEDLAELSKLMTLTYGILGLSIPKDYLFIDDYIYDYIRKQNRYHNFNKPKLKVVSNNGN